MKTASILTFITVMLSGASLQAAENMSFRGTLLEHPPCEINGGQPIAIYFGDVGVNKVDGHNYAQRFQISYDCKGTSFNKILRYVGNATAFDLTAVRSNIADFGIQLRHMYLEGVTTPFEVGSTLTIPAYVDSSTFIVTPVKEASAKLQNGTFTAGATLQLEYP